MEKVKIALLAIVALLLLIFLVDRNREPEQMKAFIDHMEQVQSDLRSQQDELRDLIAELKENGVSVSQGNAGTVQQKLNPDLTGKPILGKNFLLPQDYTHFDRSKIGGTLKQFNSSPKDFNPIISSSSTASDLHSYINDSLCTQHAKHPQLWSEGLAYSCIISDDYKTYTFKIRDDVYWQVPPIAKEERYQWLDKKVKLTAADFKAYLDTVLNPDVECPSKKSYYEDLESVDVVDELTLVIKWKKKVYTSLAFSMSLEPLPRHVYMYDQDGNAYTEAEFGVAFNKHWFDEKRQAIGVGAYELDEYVPDKIVSFKRNRNYWGKYLHFDRIEWDCEVRQPEPQWVSFQNGDVHHSSLPPTKYKSEILDGHEERFAPFDPNNEKAGREGILGWERNRHSSYSYIGWNMRNPLFDDKMVRRAMTHAFPKKRIIKEVYYGLGRPQVSNVHPDSAYCNTSLVDYEFDLKKAAALLDQAGWTDSDGDGIRDKEVNGKSLKFEFVLKYYANNVEWDSTLIIYKNELRKIGIVMKPTNYEWKELLRVYQDKDFAAVSGGWRFGLEVDFVQLWHSKYANEPRTSNHCGFVNKRADEIAVALRETFDFDERIRLAKEFQEIIHEEQPYTFFKSGEYIFIWQNKEGAPTAPVKGVIPGFDMYHPLSKTSKYLWHFE